MNFQHSSLQAEPRPEDLHMIEPLRKDQVPEPYLLDLLKDVQHWAGDTRHFGPPSGADQNSPILCSATFSPLCLSLWARRLPNGVPCQ